jgi:hypothetical protein
MLDFERRQLLRLRLQEAESASLMVDELHCESHVEAMK